MTIGEGNQAQERRESFPASRPVELVVALSSGCLEVDAGGSGEAAVELSPHDCGADGLELAARAIRETEVRFSAADGKLVVRTPRQPPLRDIGLRISASIPSRSALTARTGRGDVSVDGTLERLNAVTGSGDVEVGDVAGDVEIRAGSGDTRLGRVTGRARARAGSGSFDARGIGQAAKITTGSGSIRVGDVAADLAARTGSGSVIVENASAGRLDLATGSGDIRVGVHEGVTAEIDLVSGSGRARSELDVGPAPVSGGATVRLRARTGSGDAVVARAPG